MRQITILGSTGTIGVSTLTVMSAHPEKFSTFALTANSNVEKLYQQCLEHRPRYAVMRNPVSATELRNRLQGLDIEVLEGESGLIDVASAVEVDSVMCAIVGAAGLNSSLAAVKEGKAVLLANKESLVMSGALFMDAVRDNQASLLPIDSEHNAIFQCLPETHSKALIQGECSLKELGIQKILLTGSGGPFRTRERASLTEITPEQAIAHPNWTMGPKISVDSATMMNKGLEYIEACWLFSAKADEIEIVVHPESVIHSMVQYKDGSVLAQLGQPDMKTPIAYGLAYPERINAQVEPLDFTNLNGLHFEPGDEMRFPSLALSRDAMIAGGTAPAILNAANEVAVDAFLNNQLSFLNITQVIEQTLNAIESTDAAELETIFEADARAREYANLAIKQEFNL